MSGAADYSAAEYLRDGRSIEIRALRPDDRAEMLAAIGRTSTQSMQRRFFVPKKGFSEQELAFFLNIDFEKHVAINPRAMAIWTGHPSQARFALACCGFGLKPGAAIRTVDLFEMPVTQVFDDRAQAHENLFAQRFMMDRRRVLQARAKLIKRLPISPCPVMTWTSHSADADCHPGVQSFCALRAVDWLDVLSSQPVDYLRITLAGPLTLASHPCQMEFVAETVCLVAHISLHEEVHRRTMWSIPTLAGRCFLRLCRVSKWQIDHDTRRAKINGAVPAAVCATGNVRRISIEVVWSLRE